MNANSPSHRSVTMSHTPDTANRTMTDEAKGIGPRIAAAASVSTPARAATSPVMRERCHIGGWRMMWRSALSAIDFAVDEFALPAYVRRTTTPTARTNPIVTTRPETDAQVENPTVPSAKLGRITSSISNFTPYDDSTVATAKTAAPLTAMRNSPL